MTKSTDIFRARLRLAERCLIGAASDRKELLTDENWHDAMISVRKMLNNQRKKK